MNALRVGAKAKKVRGKSIFQTLGQLHERRKQVVRLHRKGFSVMRIVELSGLSYPTVRGVIDRYEDGGAEKYIADQWPLLSRNPL